jgi:hypothetical protein
MQQINELLEHFQINNQELLDFKDSNLGLHRVDTSRISTLLLSQLAHFQKYRTFNTFSITDVIQSLEGLGMRGCAREADQFKHEPLKGLWKAHFSDPHFLIQNIVNHWGLNRENSPKFLDLCEKVAAEELHNPSQHGWPGRLAHELVVSGYQERAQQKKLTGEWLIFGKWQSKNYYLTTAGHSASETNDQEIFTTIKEYCSFEFPFLFNSG